MTCLHGAQERIGDGVRPITSHRIRAEDRPIMLRFYVDLLSACRAPAHAEPGRAAHAPPVFGVACTRAEAARAPPVFGVACTRADPRRNRPWAVGGSLPGRRTDAPGPRPGRSRYNVSQYMAMYSSAQAKSGSTSPPRHVSPRIRRAPRAKPMRMSALAAVRCARVLIFVRDTSEWDI